MDNEMTSIESSASTVDEAIEKGLESLNVASAEMVDVEILDEGKRGLFKRPARVKLTLKTQSQETKDEVKAAVEFEADSETPAEGNWLDESEASGDEVLEIARTTIRELLEHMKINADVKAVYGETDDQGEMPVMVNIEGNDLSFLIGRRSETINALQYIASLIINKKLNRWIPLQVDVQNYRQRRERELRKLARRIAEQVAASGRKQSLEPMPANERRIIHMELRENGSVETESTGEDPYRKVVISPKG